jgi:hypothetical protein
MSLTKGPTVTAESAAIGQHVVLLDISERAMTCAIFLPLPSLQNFFVCGRTLPLWIVVFALLAQGLDSNATLGNVALSYKFAFWDGAMLPLGLGISLIIVSVTCDTEGWRGG